MPTDRRSRPRLRFIVLGGFLAIVLVGTGAIYTNAFGMGTRFNHLLARIELIVNPPPDRPIQETVDVTEPPGVGAVQSTAPEQSLSPGQTPQPQASSPAAGSTVGPGSTPPPAQSLAPGATPSPTPTPLPPRTPVDVKLRLNPANVFARQLTDQWCAVAGTQIVLAINGAADNSDAFQRQLAGQVGQFESDRDSHNGGWGPAAIASALDSYGVHGYVIHAYQDRMHAMRDAAVAISTYHAPVVMMAWRGAHTWIITGYRADADPTIFPNAQITGAYIYDPWYGWISSIWEPALPPGGFHDWPNLTRNFLPWQRPEGAYPDRDGKFILVLPTQPRLNAGQ